MIKKTTIWQVVATALLLSSTLVIAADLDAIEDKELTVGDVASSTPVTAADLDAGVEAYFQGNYAAALQELQPLAEQGDADAMFFLGIMYDEGKGVPQDARQAVHWYQQAAEQGHASAMFNLGRMYANGDGVPQDYVQAYAWYNVAGTDNRIQEAAKAAREQIRGNMTSSQVAEAQTLSRELSASLDD